MGKIIIFFNIKMPGIEKMFDLMGKAGFAFLCSGVVATRFIFVVDGGERALVFNKLKGLQTHVYGEGMHFMLPVIHQPKKFEIRTRPKSLTSVTGTRDLQQVHITLRVLFRPEKDKLAIILNNLGFDYEEKVLPSIGSEVLKSIVA